jgi:hypothetical protein
MRRGLVAICAFLLCAIGIWAAWTASERRHQAGLIPAGLQAGAPVYANTVAQGFGPGGNEAGFLVYALPPEIVARIMAEGMGWLESEFGRFEETPIAPSEAWSSVLCTGADCFSLAMYAQRYTFLAAPLDPDLLREGNAAIARPGNYYAFGRLGLLVIVPDTGRVFYVYRG